MKTVASVMVLGVLMVATGISLALITQSVLFIPVTLMLMAAGQQSLDQVIYGKSKE